jgi:hypothetical protein
LRNVVRIITETGVRVYVELMPVTREQVDLANSVLWIPDSKTPTGVTELPLAAMAVQAFGIRWRPREAVITFFPGKKARRAINAPCERFGD